MYLLLYVVGFVLSYSMDDDPSPNGTQKKSVVGCWAM